MGNRDEGGSKEVSYGLGGNVGALWEKQTFHALDPVTEACAFACDLECCNWYSETWS